MAYAHEGTITRISYPQQYPTEGTYQEQDSLPHDTNYALYATYDGTKKPYDQYVFYAYPLNSTAEAYQYMYDYDTTFNESDGGSNPVASGNTFLNKYPSGTIMSSLNGTVVAVASLTTSIPVFPVDDAAAIEAYITSGDTSGAIVDLATQWNLYIDGSLNPNYKLAWNCEGINDKDLSYSFVKISVGLTIGTTTSEVELFKELPYTQGSVKFSYSDVESLVDQPIISRNAPTLIVRLGYRSSYEESAKNSTSMGVTVYYDSSYIKSLYSVIGYLELKDNGYYPSSTGDGSTLTVKDGQEGADGYTSDDDGGYDDGKDEDENDDDTKELAAGLGVLTTTFKMSKDRLEQLGHFLWSGSIFDKFSLLNNNPIENIISCKAVPIDVSGTNQEIILGNVSTGVNGEKIANNFGRITIGSVKITEYYQNFLDYAPFTNVMIYLPYVGFRRLDTSLVMNKTIKVDYTADVITGGLLAQIWVGDVRLYEFTGSLGIDIPITSSNRAQVEAAHIESAIGVAAGAAVGNLGAAASSMIQGAQAQYHYSTSGAPSPMCVASTNRTCYVVIDRPQYQTLKAFNHTRGRMCCLSKTIGTLKGFTICDPHVDLSGINATEAEKEEIQQILSSGFFA